MIFLFFILLFVENCPLYDTIHEFSVWLRTGSYPAVINNFKAILKNPFFLPAIEYKIIVEDGVHLILQIIFISYISV